MGWKDLSYWLRGGIILGSIFLIYKFIQMVMAIVNINNSEFICVKAPCVGPTMISVIYFYLPYIIDYLVIGFVIGALIGRIYGKIKSRNK